MRKALCFLLALMLGLLFLPSVTAETDTETLGRDPYRIQWAIAMTADMAGNALDRMEEAGSSRESSWMSAFTRVPYLSPDRAVILEFSEAQRRPVLAALGITEGGWDRVGPALADYINSQFSADYTHAAQLSQAEGSTTLDYSRYFTIILLPYGEHISVTSLNAYGTVNSRSAFILSTEEISQSLGEEAIDQVVQQFGLEKPLIRIYEQDDLDGLFRENSWPDDSGYNHFGTALLSSEKRKESLLPAFIASDSPWLNPGMKYNLLVRMLCSMESADSSFLREVAETWLPSISNNPEEAVAGLLAAGNTAQPLGIAPPPIVYGEELHETELKENATFLPVFERTIPDQETESWVDVILEAAFPAERIPASAEEADYILRFVVTYEGGTSNGDAHLHYPLTRITVHDARTGEMLQHLKGDHRKLSGVVMLTRGDTWWNPLYTDLWENICDLFVKE